MKIVIDLDETLTVGANIEGVTDPNQYQCIALRDIAEVAGRYRELLLPEVPE